MCACSDPREEIAVLRQQLAERDARIASLEDQVSQVNSRTVTLHRQLFELVKDPIFILDQQTQQFLDVNNAVCDLYGYTHEELLRLHSVDISAEPAETQEAGRNSVTHVPIRWHRKKDGTVFPVELTATYLEHQGRKLQVVVGRDISARLRLEQELTSSKEFYEKVLEFLPVVVRLHDLETRRTTYLNAATKRVVGYTPEQLQDLRNPTLASIVHPEDLVLLVQHRERLLASQPGETLEVEHRLKDPEGNWRWVRGRDTVLQQGKDGKVAKIVGTVEDITLRKQAELELRDNVSLLRSIIDASTDFIYVKDRELRTVLCNKACAAAVGKTPEQCVGHTDIQNGWDPEMVKGNPQKGYRGYETDDREALKGNTVTNEHDPSLHGNKPLVFDTLKVPLRNAAGEIIGLVGNSRDVTLRVLAEEDATRDREFTRELLENMVDGVVACNAQGELVLFNRTAREWHGSDPMKVPQTEWASRYNLLHEDGITPMNAESVPLARAFRGERLQDAAMVVAAHAQPKRHVIANTSPVYDRKGNKLGAVAVMHDITERKRVAEALAAEKERLLVTLRSIADGVITTDVSGAVTLMNGVAETLTGWSFREAVGKPLSKVFNVLDAVTRQPRACTVEHFARQDVPVEIDRPHVLMSRLGGERSVTLSGAPIRGGDKDIMGLVLVFRDITNRQKLEEKLQRTQRLEAIGVLAGGIAHDFNNLLSGLFGFLQLARDGVDSQCETARCLDESLKVFGRMRDLTRQLLTFAKGGEPVKKCVELGPIINNAVRFALSGSNVAPSVFITPDLHPCNVDENQINQVLDNIVINARQAMPDGGALHVHASNVTSPPTVGMEPRPCVLISIRDEGPGIPREHLGRIFDPFFSTKPKGSGLGLATSYSIVQRHGGHLEAQSAPGQGATFNVYLPSALSQSPVAEATPQAQPVQHLGRILIMDDEESVLDVTSRLLSKVGHAITTARDGHEALKHYTDALAAGTPFDLVILDLTVTGGMGGKETMQHLLKMDPGVRAMVASGYSDDPIVAEHRKHGFVGRLTKPSTAKEMRQAVQDALAAVVKT